MGQRISPIPKHPLCVAHGCRSYQHLICPAECEALKHIPLPDELDRDESYVIPLNSEPTATCNVPLSST